jgi:hypothetical protein
VEHVVQYPEKGRFRNTRYKHSVYFLSTWRCAIQYPYRYGAGSPRADKPSQRSRNPDSDQGSQGSFEAVASYSS